MPPGCLICCGRASTAHGHRCRRRERDTTERTVGGRYSQAVAAVLYRKYRPQRFGEMVGQDHVTTALRNAVTEDRVGHAYLFSGPRGTGKTTTARLLAQALNCLDLSADGEPCGKCENCLAIADGAFFDLVELDAASNNGVDAMRELVQSVHLGLGPNSRRKVYIIDEVHMLSAAASNTLLKTLEEPPAHVVFVLATTDPHKVLPTIRSRTQHFEFTLLSAEELTGHLIDILGREGVETDASRPRPRRPPRRGFGPRCVVVARPGPRRRGRHARLRRRCRPRSAARRSTCASPCSRRSPADDVAGALVGVNELLTQGHDVRRVADDSAANAARRVHGGQRERPGPLRRSRRRGDQARARSRRRWATPRWCAAIEILGQAIVDIRRQTVADPRLVLEVAVVRVARREARTSVETLFERVERLERQLAAGGAAPPATRAGTRTRTCGTTGRGSGRVRAGVGCVTDGTRAGVRPRAATRAAKAEAPAPEPPPAGEPPTIEAASSSLAPESFDPDDVIEAWPNVLEGLNAPLRAAVQQAQPIGVEQGVVVFGVPRQRFDMINGRFRNEADTIKDAFAA